MPPTLFLLFFLVSSALSATLFVFSGFIICTARSPYQFNVRVVEDDFPQINDILLTGGVQTFAAPYIFYNFTTSAGIDHITSYHEIVINVLHNCNAAGNNSLIEFDIGSYPITHGTHYITYNMDLTNKGDPYGFALDIWVGTRDGN